MCVSLGIILLTKVQILETSCGFVLAPALINSVTKNIPSHSREFHSIRENAGLKYNDQYMFLQPTLNATTLKSIFLFRICIPNH